MIAKTLPMGRPWAAHGRPRARARALARARRSLSLGALALARSRALSPRSPAEARPARSLRYSREHVLGRNCRFLQGPATSPKRVAVIRRAIADGYDSSTVLLNYRADGTRTTRDRPHIPARASLVISPPAPNLQAPSFGTASISRRCTTSAARSSSTSAASTTSRRTRSSRSTRTTTSTSRTRGPKARRRTAPRAARSRRRRARDARASA